MELPLDMSKEDIEAAVMAHEKTTAQLQGRTPKKVIVVPGKIVNIVGQGFLSLNDTSRSKNKTREFLGKLNLSNSLLTHTTHRNGNNRNHRSGGGDAYHGLFRPPSCKNMEE